MFKLDGIYLVRRRKDESNEEHFSTGRLMVNTPVDTEWCQIFSFSHEYQISAVRTEFIQSSPSGGKRGTKNN